MITSVEALGLITARILSDSITTVKTSDAINEILAEEIFSPTDQPPFPRVSMDGIAIDFDALKERSTFEIAAIAPAGKPTQTLMSSLHCIEVMTGAPLPNGCSAVIPYEEIAIAEKIATVLNPEKVQQYANIHPRGADYKKGTLVLKKDTKLTSSHISLIASCGLETIKVLKKPTIAVISTGDELVGPGQDLLDYQIYKSNPFALKSQLEAFGFEVHQVVHLPDQKETTFSCLESLLSNNDIVILSGGVSKGKFDFVPAVLSDLGVETVFHKVRQRPGKPLLFGVGKKGQLVFGLPGNPVSCLVNLRKYICEILKPNHESKPSFYVTLTDDVFLNKDMTFFIPAKVDFGPDSKIYANPISGNGSGDFFQLRDSDGFIELDNLENRNTFKKGEVYPFYHWNF